MGERPGEQHSDAGPVEKALGTSTFGNSTAFGFSITITVTFGVASRVLGSPAIGELFAFAIGAALAVGAIEGAVTRGFRRRIDEAAPEIAMLGTALNFLSVSAAVGVAVGVVHVLEGIAGWGVASAAASIVYVLVEASELYLAERVQAARGDPDADRR